MLQILVGKKRITVGCFDESPRPAWLGSWGDVWNPPKKDHRMDASCPFPFFFVGESVNLDRNPWDFVASKFNSITNQKGFVNISGSNFPEGFPGSRVSN